MPDLGKFKGCAYAKFDYDPYKTDWVYTSVRPKQHFPYSGGRWNILTYENCGIFLPNWNKVEYSD